MSPNKKKIWLAALRGGKYRHTNKGMLCDGTGGYSALGVLADLSPSLFTKEVDPRTNHTVYVSKQNPTYKAWKSLPDWDLAELGLADIHVNNINRLNDISNLYYNRVIEYIKVNL